MASFIVFGVSNSGSVEKRKVDAIDMEEAKVKSHFKKDRIVDVKKDFNHALNDLFRFKPKIDNQILLLSTLSAMAGAGQNVREILFSMLDSHKREYEVKDISKFDEVYRLSDILRQLNFERSVITLVAAGEKAGDIAGMLKTATNTLKKRQEIDKRANQGLKGSLIMMAFALMLLITLPLSLGSVITEIIQQPDITINTNSVTDFFLLLSYILNNFWALIITFIGLSIFFRKIIWRIIRPFYLLRDVWELQKINRSIDFLSSYKPFLLSGIDSLTTMNILAESSVGETKEVFEKSAKDLKGGLSISKVVDNNNFTKLMRIGFGSIERVTAESQIEMIENMESSLININEIYATKISVFLKTLSMAITASMVIMLFIGVILPLQSISA